MSSGFFGDGDPQLILGFLDAPFLFQDEGGVVVCFRVPDRADEVGQGRLDIAVVHKRLGEFESCFAIKWVCQNGPVVAVDRLVPALL